MLEDFEHRYRAVRGREVRFDDQTKTGEVVA
jgi:hypothetical protein